MSSKIISMKQIIESKLNKQRFLEIVNELTKRPYKDQQAANSFAILHNEKKIDLIKEFYKLKNNKTFEFFRIRRLLENALPQLQIHDIPNLLITLQKVIVEAGEDMASHRPLNSFESLLDTDLKFAMKVLDHLWSNEYSVSFLMKTLISISKHQLDLAIDNAEKLIASEKVNLVTDTILALGQINYSSNKLLLDKSIDLICSYSQINKDERITASMIQSLTQISLQLQSSDSRINQKISNILEHSNYNEMVVHACVIQILHHTKELNQDLKDLLLSTIPKIKSTSTGTINYLDISLSQLCNENYEQTLILLEKLFIATNYEIRLQDFDNLTSYLLQNENNNKLSSLVTRWFLARKIELNRFAADLLGSHEVEVQFDLTLLTNRFATDYLFLAKKTCGWCFTNPTTAISLIFSVFKDCPTNQENEIAEIIFNPLLISYPSKVSDFLIKNKELLSEQKHQYVENILANLKTYHEALKASNSLKELAVEQSEYFAYRRYNHQIMNEAYEQSRKDSIFSSLFAESTLLYGKSTAFIVHTSEGSQRQTMPLHSFSHTVEFPSLEVLDSTSLHNVLLSFRAEGVIK